MYKNYKYFITHICKSDTLIASKYSIFKIFSFDWNVLMAKLSGFVHQSHGPLMLDHTNQRFLKGPWNSCGLIEPWNLLSSPVELIWSREATIKEAVKKKLQINWEPPKQSMYSHNMNLFTYMIHVPLSNIVFLHKRLYSYGTRFSTWWFQPMWKIVEPVHVSKYTSIAPER